MAASVFLIFERRGFFKKRLEMPKEDDLKNLKKKEIEKIKKFKNKEYKKIKNIKKDMGIK